MSGSRLGQCRDTERRPKTVGDRATDEAATSDLQ